VWRAAAPARHPAPGAGSAGHADSRGPHPARRPRPRGPRQEDGRTALRRIGQNRRCGIEIRRASHPHGMLSARFAKRKTMHSGNAIKTVLVLGLLSGLLLFAGDAFGGPRGLTLALAIAVLMNGCAARPICPCRSSM